MSHEVLRDAAEHDAGRQRRPSDPPTPEHPLLDLQHKAGNAAVAQLLAVQRHTLNPDEEAGS
jgi:hypothetical protein